MIDDNFTKNLKKLNSFYEPGTLDDLPEDLRQEFQVAYRAFVKRWVEAKTGVTQEKTFLKKLHELLAIQEMILEIEKDEKP